MASTISIVADLFSSLHQQLRDGIEGLDDEALNWSPGPEMNSIAVLVVHTVGSELDTLQLVRGIAGDREREAEFQVSGATKAELLAAVDRADERLAEHAGVITEDDLAATRERAGRAPQIGLHWLLNNYGHAREHLGHLHMTAQFWRNRT